MGFIIKVIGHELQCEPVRLLDKRFDDFISPMEIQE